MVAYIQWLLDNGAHVTVNSLIQCACLWGIFETSTIKCYVVRRNDRLLSCIHLCSSGTTSTRILNTNYNTRTLLTSLYTLNLFRMIIGGAAEYAKNTFITPIRIICETFRNTLPATYIGKRITYISYM